MSRKNKWRAVMIVGISFGVAIVSAIRRRRVPRRPRSRRSSSASKNFTEEYILGQLYSQALEAKGFSVAVPGDDRLDRGHRHRADERQDQRLSGVPRGRSLTVVFHKSSCRRRRRRWSQAQELNGKRGITCSTRRRSSTSTQLAVRKATAKKYGLKTVADLKKVPNLVDLRVRSSRTREEGLIGMKNVYGLTKMKFVSLARISVYQALDQKKFIVDDVFSTDPQLASGEVRRPQGPEAHLRRVAERRTRGAHKLPTALGSKLRQTMNAVTAKLTQAAILAMNTAVVIDKQTPAAVASAFLKANDLK